VVQPPNMEQASELADTLQALMERADGTPLMFHDESRDGPGPQQMRVRNSMVRFGKQALPERFDAYDKHGNRHSLPTAMMTAMLSKPRADAPAERAFHTHIRGMTRETCSICPAPKTPWDGACEFCAPGSGKARAGAFPTENDYIVHKRRLHPEENDAQERVLDRLERQALLKAQERLAEAMLTNQQQRSSDGVQQDDSQPAVLTASPEMIACPDCGNEFRSQKGLDFHKRRWCKGKVQVNDGH